MSGFRHRGLIEGFYGPPWAHVDRLWMLEGMGRWGMTCYVHGPKDDPFHRERWRERYPEDTVQEFAELVRHGERHGIETGFALSPGLSITYSSQEDRRDLVDKIRGFTDIGARRVVLAVDDVPARLVHEADRRLYSSLAAAHVDLVSILRESLDPAVDLWLVPTEYLGIESCAYLEELGRTLPSEIEVAWTGRTVLSPTVSLAEAQARAQTLRRRPWLWDNLPVADGPMRHMLHLAPYLGRDPGLAESVCGILLNPMQHARASAVTVHTACHYMRDPEGYDPEAAWSAAVEEIAPGVGEAAHLFAGAHRFAPQSPDVRDTELEGLLARLRDALRQDTDPEPPLEGLCSAVRARLEAATRVRDLSADRRWVAEIEPWLESHRIETERMQIGLDALAVLAGDRTAADKALAYLRMEARLTRLPAVRAVSYGPRRVLFPQLRSMGEDDMAFGPDPTLIRDRCLADEFVDLAAALALESSGPRR